jgi:hypothetical protein
LSEPDADANQFFFPTLKTWEAAKEELQHQVTRTPESCEQSGSRWKLKTIRAACRWLKEHGDSVAWRVLKRCKIRLKRGRQYVHSPDLDYLEKLAAIVAALRQAMDSNGEVILVFADEYTMERQPSVASEYTVVGAKSQALAKRSHRANSKWRYRGYINALTGQVTYLDASLIGVKQLVKAHAQLRMAYPDARVIYVVEDNWPVHYHPDVLVALQPQTTPFALKTPLNWPKEPSAKAQRLNLPIQLLPLPTYASWCNPIEKLWRRLKQEVLHLHRNADDWDTLKQKTREFLSQFEKASSDLLRYVGLTESSSLYGAVLATKPPKT